jgi:hypothetical protein
MTRLLCGNMQHASEWDNVRRPDDGEQPPNMVVWIGQEPAWVQKISCESKVVSDDVDNLHLRQDVSEHSQRSGSCLWRQGEHLGASAIECIRVRTVRS